MPEAGRPGFRPFLLLVLCLAGGLSASCVPAPAAPLSPPRALAAQLESGGDCHRAVSERFVFVSDPWINLHHFLFQWARNVPRRPPTDPQAVEVPESGQLHELGESERAAWDRAVRFYRERLASRNLVHDRGLIALRGPLGEIACDGGTPDGIAADLRGVLLDAMPVYRRHWWPEHLARNQEWIAQLTRAAAPYETVLTGRLAEVYGGKWPDERIRVDITAYASWQGAYTTNRPNQITIAADPALRGVKGVDLLLHEVSHASFFEQPLLGQLSAAFQAHGADLPSGLVHVVQFVTASELLRSQLRGAELRGFRAFATGLYRINPEWDRFRKVLEAHWIPFLQGRIERSEALDRIAVALAEPGAAREANHENYFSVGNRICSLRIDRSDLESRLRARRARP